MKFILLCFVLSSFFLSAKTVCDPTLSFIVVVWLLL